MGFNLFDEFLLKTRLPRSDQDFFRAYGARIVSLAGEGDISGSHVEYVISEASASGDDVAEEDLERVRVIGLQLVEFAANKRKGQAVDAARQRRADGAAAASAKIPRPITNPKHRKKKQDLEKAAVRTLEARIGTPEAPEPTATPVRSGIRASRARRRGPGPVAIAAVMILMMALATGVILVIEIKPWIPGPSNELPSVSGGSVKIQHPDSGVSFALAPGWREVSATPTPKELDNGATVYAFERETARGTIAPRARLSVVRREPTHLPFDTSAAVLTAAITERAIELSKSGSGSTFCGPVAPQKVGKRQGHGCLGDLTRGESRQDIGMVRARLQAFTLVAVDWVAPPTTGKQIADEMDALLRSLRVAL